MFGYYKFKRKLKHFLYENTIDSINNGYDFTPKNSELILLGNGYTLDETINLKNIRNNDIFVCNEFFKHPYYNEIIIENNVLHFALDGSRSFEKIIPAKRNITSAEAYNLYIDPIICNPVNIIMPHSILNYALNKYPDAKIFPSEKLFKELKSKNKNCGNITIAHTPQGMLLAGILLGYKKIHMYGLEHNYVKDILNKDPKCGTHFYRETYRQVLEINDGKGLPREAYKTTLSKLFEGNAKTFKCYEQLADLAKELGVEVIDHSKGSLFMYQDYSLWDLVEPKDKN
jgi:hypothetical protein